MTELDEQGRPEPPLAADEAATLFGFLDYQRATFAWKCRGLDEAGLRQTVGVSTITLGGLLKHLALVETSWFTGRLWGERLGAPWDGVDWDADPDWEWRTAADDSPGELFAIWDAAVVQSREKVATALERDGLGQPLAVPFRDGRRAGLRWVVVHMIEEYARHNGHADLLREAVDGQSGE
jgi:hypothetical protein